MGFSKQIVYAFNLESALEPGIEPGSEAGSTGEAIVGEQVDKLGASESVIRGVHLAIFVQVEEIQDILFHLGVIDGDISGLCRARKWCGK